MGNNSFDEDVNYPTGSPRSSDGEIGKKDPGLDSLVSSVRADPLLTSDIVPAKKSILEQMNPKLIVGILLGLFIFAFLVFVLTGSRRQNLQNNLAALMHTRPTVTSTYPPTALPVTPSPLPPTSTPLPSPTLPPTLAPTQTATSKASLLEATATSSSSCRNVSLITLADVGQTICVQGIVKETVERPNAFMVIFNKNPGSFYWVSYDMVWSQAELDTCYQVTGKIEQIANTPILLFDYGNIPQVCP